MMITLLTSEQCRMAWQNFNHEAQKEYFAFYSSILGGITTDPSYMNLPIDDHMVHRGDGVFEALKCRNGGVYLWQAHTRRLQDSAAGLSLKVPSRLEEVVKATARAAGKDCIIRIFLSRGPGQFSTNPYDSIGEQLYVVATKISALSPVKYEKGVVCGRSQIPTKESWLAQLKTCNYLPNVMMKKEAVDRKLDFTIGFDRDGFVTEGSTENIVLVSKNNELIRPHFTNILKGTTMNRTFILAEKLIQDGMLAGIAQRDLHEKDIQEAREVMMIGTTLDVLPVTSYEGKPIGSGQVGSVAKALLPLVLEDQKSGPDLLKI